MQIVKKKIGANLLNEIMKNETEFYEIFVKLGFKPGEIQQNILKKCGISLDNYVVVFSAIVHIASICKLSSVSFVEHIGMVGRPEIIIGI